MQSEAKSLLNMQVKPGVAVLVIGISLLFLASYYWASDRVAEVPGAGHLHVAPNGHLFVQVGNRLLEHDVDGRYIKTHDLQALGIDFSMGDYAFFRNGDLLLRRGLYDLSLWERVRTYMRLEDQRAQAAEDSTGLFRCRLEDLDCSRFGDGSIDFHRVYHLVVHPVTEEVYASDPSRHWIRKFSPGGEMLALKRHGMRFPNQLYLKGDALYVADTNHHQVQVLDTDTGRFGKALELLEVNPREARQRGEIWPNAVIAVGEEWWVINMRNDMRDGGVYRFDAHWKPLGRIDLPEDADPVDLEAFGEEVLVSDYANRRVYRVGRAGQWNGLWQSAELDAEFRAVQEHYAEYNTWKWMTVAGFVLFVVVGLGYAVSRSLQAGRAFEYRYQETVPVNVTSPLIHWIDTNPKQRRQWLWASGIIILIILAAFASSCSLGSYRALLPTLAMLIAILPVFVFLYIQSRNRIGVLDDVLILVDHKGRHAAARGDQVFYSDLFLLVGDIVLPLGTGAQPAFPKQAMIEYVYPLLKSATQLDNVQMQTLFLRKKSRQFLLPTLWLLLCLALFLALNSR